jgi:ABC-type glycerol-3-phosphate transport system permease component
VRALSRTVLYIIVLAAVMAAVLPLVWMVSTSMKPEGQILSYPPRWLPLTPTFENYTSVLRRFAFGRWTLNSIVVAIAATGSVVLLDAMAGYALARMRSRTSNVLFALIISMLLVPIQATVIPLFLLFAEVHLLDSFAALILPTTANITGVLLMRQFFLGFPMELEEAARIDGAGEGRIWWSVVMPMAAPALGAVAALTFVSSWNSLLWPLIAINSDRVRTLPVGIAQYMGSHAGTSGSAPAYGPALASATMATLPALLIFLLLQRYFVRGIATTGLKG